MNDYLSRLAAINQNPEKGIRPRIPMRFELRLGRWPERKGFDAVSENDGYQETYAPGEMPAEDTLTGSPGKPAVIRPPGIRRRQVVPAPAETADHISGALEPEQSRKGAGKSAIPSGRSGNIKEAASPVVEVFGAELSSGETETREETRPDTKKPDDAMHRSPRKKGRRTVMPAVPDAAPWHAEVPKKEGRAGVTAHQEISGYRGISPVMPGTKNSIKIAVREEIDKYTRRPLASDTGAEPVRKPKDRESLRPSGMKPVAQERSPASIAGETKVAITPDAIIKRSPVMDFPARKIPVSETPVLVTIGRIEIRAGPPDHGQKKQKAPPALNLEEHAAHRRKGGAG